jgi:hypothetical protein
MTRLLLIALVVLVTCGFGSCGVRKDAPPPADAHCDLMCFVPCTADAGDTGARWEGDAADPAMWDALVEEPLAQMVDKLRTCETRRKACAMCLERLEREGVTQ